MGIFFSIFSYALDGTINYVDKLLVSRYKIPVIFIAFYSGLFAFLFGLLLFISQGFQILDTKTVLVLLASGFLTQLFLFPYFKALSLDDTSIVVPFFQLTPVIVLILSYFFLGETLTAFQYIGATMIITASFVLSVQQKKKKMFTLRKSLGYIILADFCTALAIILFKTVTVSSNFWVALSYEGFGIALCAILILLITKNAKKLISFSLKLPKMSFSALLLNEIIYVSARYMRFFAVLLIPVGVVSVLSGLQQVFVLCYGVMLTIFFPKLIKESLSKKTLTLKIISIFCIFIGLVFIFI